MEVKKGYKRTESGVLPEEWEIVQLATICQMKSGENITGADIDEFSNYPCYGGNGLRGYSNRFTHEGSYALIGRQGALCGNVMGVQGKFFASEHAIVVTASTRTNIHWLTYVLKGMQLNKYSESSAQPGLSVSKLLNLEIAFPPTLAEQEAIAKVLSDADFFLEAIEQLLTKKRLIKQSAMQELLSGQKRLPEFDKKQGYKQTQIGVFPIDWEIVPLKDISSLHGRIGWQGLKQSEFTMNADQPFLITGMNFKDGEISWDEVYHISDERYEIAKEIQLQSGDVLMTKDGTIGKTLYVDHIPDPGKASLNSHLLVFRPLNKRYVPKFLFYQLNSRTFHNHIESEKSGTTFFGITQEAVGNYIAFLPSIAEQIAITGILSNMDAEISALEVKLVKARQVKAGLMQELLAGKIRLV